MLNLQIKSVIPISASKTSVICRCEEPSYTNPIPKRAAICIFCGTSNSIDVGGSNASTCILNIFVVAVCMVPRLVAANPNNNPILVSSLIFTKYS